MGDSCCCCSRLGTLKTLGAFLMEANLVLLRLRHDGTKQGWQAVRALGGGGAVRWGEPLQQRDPTLALTTATPAGSPRAPL